MRDINRYARLAFVAFACGAAAACEPAEDLPAPRVEPATPPESPLAPHDLRLVGHNDLQARSAYQPIVHAYGERRILFVGHHAGEALNPATGYIEKNGLSILDVTDPAAPQYLGAHAADRNRGERHAARAGLRRQCAAERRRLQGLRDSHQRRVELRGGRRHGSGEAAFLRTIAETGTSSRPESERGDRETHKFQWDCATGIAYLNGTAPGWRVTRVLQVFDLGDPTAPKHVRDFGLAGYEPTATGPVPGAAGRGAASAVRRRQSHVLGLQQRRGGHAADRRSRRVPARRRRRPTAANLRAPEIARLDLPSYWGVHTAKPIYDFEIADYADNSDARTRDLLLVASEAGTFRCQEPRDVLLIFDITEEETPLPIATFQVPEEPGDFCHRGGRFGPHSFADAYHPAFDKKLVVLAYFNAGMRVVDIRNPFEPKEVARFIPEVTANTTESCIEIDGARQCDRAIQTNNVNIDDRGYIYAVDRASTGLHILELTGAARAIAGL